MTTQTKPELTVRLRRLHAKQREVNDCPAKRIIERAGRRSGKTVGAATKAIELFLAGHRILYGVPMQDQVDRFWYEAKRALAEPIEAGIYYKNETLKLIERSGTENRIKAKTCWNADTLRGDYADELILDEWQHMDEDAWELVGAPMLLDNNGNALFIYTPPSLRSRSVSKARDPYHAAKMYKRALEDTTGRWAAFSFTSHDNPYISEEALRDITLDMTNLAYRQEIMAEDIEEVPGALWHRNWIEDNRSTIEAMPNLQRVVVAVDPATTSGAGSNETGIAVAGFGDDGEIYVLFSRGYVLSPHAWATRVLDCYDSFQADRIIVEDNQGGEMVEYTIRQERQYVPITRIHAKRGKTLRAEPVAAMYEQGRVHHVNVFPELEDQMCAFPIAAENDDLVDSLVHAVTELIGGQYEGDAGGFSG